MIFFASVLLMMVVPATAQGQLAQDTVDAPFGWKVKTAFENFYVDVWLQNPEKKAEEFAKQADSTQREIEELSERNEPIPPEFVARVDDRLDNAERVLLELDVPEPAQTGIDNALDSITEERQSSDRILDLKLINDTKNTISELRKVSELNEIRLLVNDFKELRDDAQNDNVGNDVQLETRANEIDQRVNDLDLVREHCSTSISSLDLAFDSSPYASLQEKCPALQNMSLEEANKRLALIGSEID